MPSTVMSYHVLCCVVCRTAEFGFRAIDHLKIGEKPQWFNTSHVIAGSRFVTLQNEAALLEIALINFTLQRLTSKHGFTVALPPDMVRSHYVAAAGFQPRSAEHTQIYSIAP